MVRSRQAALGILDTNPLARALWENSEQDGSLDKIDEFIAELITHLNNHYQGTDNTINVMYKRGLEDGRRGC